MERVRLVLLLPFVAAIALLSSPAPTEACTAVRLTAGRGVLIAKNYDWHMDQGFVVLNKREVHKRSLLLRPGDRPAEWTSRFASFTFNQYGEGFPNGGMNEKGLVVEALWLAGSRFPKDDDRPTLNELQWVQYQLDRFESVREVLLNASETRISRVHGDVHYMVCDKGGECAVIEHLDGKLVVTSGRELTQPVLTNHSFAESAAYLERHRAFHEEPPAGTGSLARFARAAIAAEGSKAASADEAFSLLDTVKSGKETQWQLVYEPSAGRVHFRTQRSPKVRTLTFDKLDRGCVEGSSALELDAEGEGMVNKALHALPREQNEALVRSSLEKTVPVLADTLTPILAAWPTAQVCEAKKR